MDKRRNFIKKTAAGALGLSTFNLSELFVRKEDCLTLTEKILYHLATSKDRTEENYTANVLWEAMNGNFVNAMKFTRAGLKFFPDSLLILKESAAMNFKYKNYAGATILCREILELRPNDIKSYNNLAVATGRNGNWAEAMDISNKALQIEPNNSKALANLGFAYHKLGDNKSAIKLMKKALLEKPSYTKAQTWLEKILDGECLA